MENPVFFSLGRYCATAFHLRRLDLGHAAGPLDWMGSDDAGGLLELLENRFDGFMDLENLEVYGRHRGFWVVRDERYRVRTAHDFPVKQTRSDRDLPLPQYRSGQEPRWLIAWDRLLTRKRRNNPPCWTHQVDGGSVILESYPSSIRQVRRRVRRLRSALQSRRPVVLVRNEDSMVEIVRLYELLCRIRKVYPFVLVALGPDPEFRKDSGIENLVTHWMPKIDSSQGPDSWYGDSASWDVLPALVPAGPPSQ